MSESSPVFLLEVATGGLVPAELVCGIGEQHMLDWHNAWQPALGALKATLLAQGVPKSLWPQSGHWVWPDKIAEAEGQLGFQTFCVIANGMTQAMMRVDITKEARLDDVKGKPLVYLDYLEVAPWNQSFPGWAQRFRGAGTVLLTAAAALSVEEGFKGRVGAHSLPQSETFYEVAQMIDLGPDAEVQNLRYFEMTSDVALALTAKE